MKTCLSLFFMIILAFFCKGQDNFSVQLDSLNRVLSQSKKDTNRLRTLENLSLLWQSKDLSKSIQHVEEAIKLAQNLNQKEWVVGLMYGLSYSYMINGEATKAFKILQELIQIVPPDGGGYQTVLAFMSLTYKSIGDYENALLYCQQSFALNERLQKERKDYNPNGYLGNPVSLAEIFEKLNRLDSALYYIQMGYERLSNNPMGVGLFKWEIPLTYGIIESRLNHDSHAAELYFMSLNEAKKQNYNIGIESAELSLAHHYYKIKRPDSAILYATHAFESARRTPTLQVVSDAGFLLKKMYGEQKNYAKSLYFNDLATIAKDSLVNIDKIRQIQALTLKKERRQQEAEIQKIASENRLKQGSLILGLLFLTGFILFLYRNNRQKQKLNEKIEALNNSLEQKVEERTAELQNALNEVKTAFDKGQYTERKRVSADLHDEIGSALSSIAIFSDITKIKAQKSAPELVSELDKIGSKSRDIIQTMRDTIWTLNEENQQSLWERMYQSCSETLQVKNITLDWQFLPENDLPKFPFNTNRNLFLAFKEAITNILKHAEATSIKVEGKTENGHFTLKITDNGKGFDINALEKQGNGLHNFEKRMEDIGGLVIIESIIDQGTCIQFTIT